MRHRYTQKLYSYSPNESISQSDECLGTGPGSLNEQGQYLAAKLCLMGSRQPGWKACKEVTLPSLLLCLPLKQMHLDSDFDEV